MPSAVAKKTITSGTFKPLKKPVVAKRRVSLSQLLNEETSKFKQECETLMGTLKQGAEKKTSQEISKYSKIILTKLQIHTGNVEILRANHCDADSMIDSALGNNKLSERKRLLEFKRAQNGINEIIRAQNQLIGQARDSIVSWERWAREIWQPLRSNFILDHYTLMVATLTRFQQPRKLLQDFDYELELMVSAIKEIIEVGPVDDTVSLDEILHSAEKFRTGVLLDIKQARSQIDVLEAKFDDSIPFLIETMQQQLLDCKFHVDALNNPIKLRSLIGAAKFPRERFEKDLHALEDKFAVEFGEVSNIIGKLQEIRDCFRDYIDFIDEAKRTLSSDIETKVASYQKDMGGKSAKLADIVNLTQKSKMKAKIQEFEQSYSNINSEQAELSRKHFQDIVSAVEICKLSIDQKFVTIKSKQETAINQLKKLVLENKNICNGQFDAVSHLDGERWVLPKRAIQEFNEFVEEETFKHQNRLNTFLFYSEDLMENFDRQVVQPQIAQIEKECKERETKMQELAQELMDIRLDFHERFENISGLILQYASEIETRRQQVYEVSVSENLHAFIKEHRSAINGWLNNISSLIKEATEDFQKRYAKITAYQNAATISSSSSSRAKADKDDPSTSIGLFNRDHDGLSPKQFWEGALEVFRHKTTELVPEYARIAGIRLKDWLVKYQAKFNVVYRNMRVAGGKFEETVVFKVKEWEFMCKLDALVKDHQREMSYMLRKRRSAIAYFKQEFTITGEELLNKCTHIQQALATPGVQKTEQIQVFLNSCQFIEAAPLQGMEKWIQRLSELLSHYPIDTNNSDALKKIDINTKMQSLMERTRAQLDQQCEQYIQDELQIYADYRLICEEIVHATYKSSVQRFEEDIKIRAMEIKYPLLVKNISTAVKPLIEQRHKQRDHSYRLLRPGPQDAVYSLLEKDELERKQFFGAMNQWKADGQNQIAKELQEQLGSEWQKANQAQLNFLKLLSFDPDISMDIEEKLANLTKSVFEYFDWIKKKIETEMIDPLRSEQDRIETEWCRRYKNLADDAIKYHMKHHVAVNVASETIQENEAAENEEKDVVNRNQ